MTSEQHQIIQLVFSRFNDGENHRPMWTQIDETLWKLSWLDGDQLFREAATLYEDYKVKKIQCNMTHAKSECFAPKIVSAVDAVLDVYDKTGQMLPEYRYILQYFLTLHQLGVIALKA